MTLGKRVSEEFERAGEVVLLAVTPFPLVSPGDDLRDALRQAFAASGVVPEHGDILILTHKVVSRAEGRVVQLDTISPSSRAVELASQTGKDPRLVELILRESKELVRVSQGHIIAEHRLGHVSANAGVDQSNSGGKGWVCLLPRDPDGTAAALCTFVRNAYKKEVAVLICDSHGRPFRRGTVGTCIGACGLAPLLDLRGQHDLFGYVLQSSMECIADELCAAANLLMGQAAEAVPLIVVRGFRWRWTKASIAEVLRPRSEDLFRGP